MQKRIKVLVVSGLLALGIGMSGVPASAAPATSGYGWDGQFPDTTPCAASAKTVSQATIYNGNAVIGYVQLRYSTTCRTVWGKVIAYYNQGVGERADVTRAHPGGHEACTWTQYSSSDKGYVCFTRMLYDAGTYSEAYGQAPNWYGGFADASTGTY